MMFRDYLRIATYLVFASLPLFFGWQNFEKIRSSNLDFNQEHASRQTTSLLRQDEWVEFQIPAGARNIRLMTNAAVSAENAPDPTQNDPRSGWRYSLNVELCDARGKRISTHDYHFRSRVRQLVDADTGELIFPLFFGETMLPGTETRMMQMAIDRADQDVSIMRVRLDQSDIGVEEVVARVDTRVERDDYAQRSTWNRLSAEGKSRVCRFNVYNHHLLTESERVNLMRWQWVDSPTIGICESRYLYFVGEDEDRELNEKLYPAGLRVAPTCQGVLPLPNEPGRYRIEVTNLTEPQRRVELNLKWMPPTPHPEVLEQRVLEGEFLEFSGDWSQGGTLTLAADGDVVVRAHWQPESADEFEITPELSASSYFLVDHRPVEFEVSHYQKAATPFRITGRVPSGELFADVDFSEHPALYWEAIDDSGDVIQKGMLDGSYPVSKLDRLVMRSEIVPLTNPCTWYFNLPADVATIRFSADSPMLITGAVRPPGFRRKVRVPEAYSTFDRSELRHRSWFNVRPSEHLDLIRLNRSFLVRTQQRPKARSEAIVEGNYEWESYLPNSDWVGRQILVSKDDGFPIREEAIGVTYFGVMPNQLYRFTKTTNRQAVTKVFFARRESFSDADELRILIDGKTVVRKKIHSARGEIRVDDLDIPSAGSIEVQAGPNMQLFVSGVILDGQPRYLKRTAQRLDQGPLRFKYRKETAGEELLTIQFFRPLSESQRCQINASVIGLDERSSFQITPSTEWSVLDRAYDIAPGSGVAYLFGSSDRLDDGQKCFLKFNADVPAGDYLVEIEQTGGQNGFVLLYQTRVSENVAQRNEPAVQSRAVYNDSVRKPSEGSSL